jgi:SAM-dependent methyltransferase
MKSAGGESLEELLDEQAVYYRAVAPEYEKHALPLPGGSEVSEVSEALDAFRPTGSVLELACGPGTWTAQLLRHAADVTAVDASAEMLAIASARVGAERVRFVSADLFRWQPDRRYDVVFFGFWLSHVPPERFASFWSLDGTAYRIVKVPHRPADLEQQIKRIGWRIKVRATSGPFFWGAGGRAYD